MLDTCLESASRCIFYIYIYSGAGIGGREEVSRPHLIHLKTWTVKWNLLTLFEMLIWNFIDKSRTR